MLHQCFNFCKCHKYVRNHKMPKGNAPEREAFQKAFVKALRDHPIIWKQPRRSPKFSKEMLPAYEAILKGLKAKFSEDLEMLRYYEFDDVEGLKIKWSNNRLVFYHLQKKIKDGKIEEKEIKWYLYRDYKLLIEGEDSINETEKHTQEKDENSNENVDSHDDTFSTVLDEFEKEPEEEPVSKRPKLSQD